MTTKYKLAVSDTTIVNIVAQLKDASGRQNQYKFDLICKRKGADELKEQMDGGATTKDVLREVTTGWRGQRLVLEQDDSPAEFSAEAFEALLDIGGMHTVLFNAFYRGTSATEKN